MIFEIEQFLLNNKLHPRKMGNTLKVFNQNEGIKFVFSEHPDFKFLTNSLNLIDQDTDVYIVASNAFPQINEFSEICGRLRVGLILYDSASTGQKIRIIYHSKRESSKLFLNKLQFITPGTADIITDLRRESIIIAKILLNYGAVKPAKLRAEGAKGNILKILAKNSYGWFVRTTGDKYALSEKGKKEIDFFKE